jgi:hypothetical protein
LGNAVVRTQIAVVAEDKEDENNGKNSGAGTGSNKDENSGSNNKGAQANSGSGATITDQTGRVGKFQSYSVQDRQWFASSVDDVIVGRLSCRGSTSSQSEGSANEKKKKNKDKGSTQIGCLNVALQLSREEGRELMLNVTVSSLSASSRGSSSPLSSFAGAHLIISSTADALVPYTFMCMAMQCSSSSTSGASNWRPTSHHSSKEKAVLGCYNSDIADVIVAVEKEDALYAADHLMRGSGGNPNDEDVSVARAKLADRCWQRLENAAALGHEKLLLRHKTQFRGIMNRVDFHVDSPGTMVG